MEFGRSLFRQVKNDGRCMKIVPGYFDCEVLWLTLLEETMISNSSG
jgi:hypothetical protein